MTNSRCLSQMHVDCRTPASAGGVHLAATPTRNPGTRANTRAHQHASIIIIMIIIIPIIIIIIIIII